MPITFKRGNCTLYPIIRLACSKIHISGKGFGGFVQGSKFKS